MEAEPSTMTEAAAKFRADVADWNSSAYERHTTRQAIRETLTIIPSMIDAAPNHGEAAAGIVPFLAEAIGLLSDQIGILEERIEALEAAR